MGSYAKPVIYVVDPYHASAIEHLRDRATTEQDIDIILRSNPREALWSGSSGNVVALLTRSETQLDASVIQNAPSSLKYIVKQGVGVDNIDLAAAKSRQIKVYNTPALNSEAVAELTITLALCVARRVNEIDNLIRNTSASSADHNAKDKPKALIRSQLLGKSLYKKTLGIVGMGNIGFEVAKKWVGAMEGEVIAFDPHVSEKTAGAWERTFNQNSSPQTSTKIQHPGNAPPSSRHHFTRSHNLDDLLANSDVLTLHVPLLSSTKNLISTHEFATMKKDAILINCARGGIVDEDALLEALNSGHLFGAGLDAMTYEPPSLERYGNTLLTHPSVIMTPHVGASTEENQTNSGICAVDIAVDLLCGTKSETEGCLNF